MHIVHNCRSRVCSGYYIFSELWPEFVCTKKSYLNLIRSFTVHMNPNTKRKLLGHILNLNVIVFYLFICIHVRFMFEFALFLTIKGVMFELLLIFWHKELVTDVRFEIRVSNTKMNMLVLYNFSWFFPSVKVSFSPPRFSFQLFNSRMNNNLTIAPNLVIYCCIDHSTEIKIHGRKKSACKLYYKNQPPLSSLIKHSLPSKPLFGL